MGNWVGARETVGSESNFGSNVSRAALGNSAEQNLLGVDNTEFSNYATKVSGEGGSSTLSRIVDISAGTYGSSAINEFGWVYVWGNGTNGEMGNGTTTTNKAPVKTTLNTGISVSTGAGHNVALSHSGKVYTWGKNNAGQLGIGSLTNNTILSKIADKITEISASGCETIVKDIDKKVYGAGLNTSGQLGQGTFANAQKLTQVVLPEEAVSTTTEETQEIPAENPVRYIKAGAGGTTIQLKDGKVYTVGINTKGELGNGANENKNQFVRGLTNDKKGTLHDPEIGELEGTIMIGRSSGESASLNRGTINETGRVYTSGANTNGQIGNNTKDDTNYFTPMAYIRVDYPEKIEMKQGDTKELTEKELQYLEIYFNIHKEDIMKKSLLEKGKMQDTEIATYNSVTNQARIEGVRVGNTTLIVKDEETKTLIYIPVKILARNTDGTEVPDVKTGKNFTIALKADGTVWSFGTNTNGELGVGEQRVTNIPNKVETRETVGSETDFGSNVSGDKIEQISVGNSHVIALTEEGKVYTWGLNSNGQLGNGSNVKSNTPVEISIPKATELVKVINDTVIKIIANKNTSYAITQQGKVYAWGEGYTSTPTLLEKTINTATGSEEIAGTTDGVGDTAEEPKEIKLDLIDISTNYMLDVEGNIYNKNTDKKIEIDEKIKYITEGTNHTLFLSETGKGYGIGKNTYGQLGDGSNNDSTENVTKVQGENILKLEAGDCYTIALTKKGDLLEWGINRAGQLGSSQDDVEETNTPTKNTKVEALLQKVQKEIMIIDAGGDHVTIGLTDGNVYAWGLNTDGELGNGTNDNTYEPKLVGKNIVEANINNLKINEEETFDIDGNTTYFNLLKEVGNKVIYESKDSDVITVNRETGEAKGIKQGKTIIVAREEGTDNISVIQVRVLPQGIEIEPEVATSGSHTVTLKVDGTVWSYGNNTNGELGNGTTDYSDEPVQAEFPEEVKIVQIGAGEKFSIALDSNGNVWTWGANDYGQLGYTSVGNVTKPQKVEGLSNITKITAGSYTCLVIDEYKDIYGWGLDSNGELGIGSYTNIVRTPTKAKYITDIIDIEAGKNHTIALKSTGEVYVTGLNMYGVIGNGSTEVKKISQFAKVESIKGIGRIGATESGNITATVDGRVYTWGLNIYGELGLGDKNNRSTPEEVQNLSNIVDIDGGKNHSIALDRNGKVYLTGSNKYGQLGDGTTNESTTFKMETSLNDVMTVSAGNTYTAVAKEDGTVWGFGDYNHGDITLKSKTNSLVPMQVGNDAFGLGVIKVTVKKGETVSLAQNLAYSFNLIYLDQNNRESISYESLRNDIATVDGEGIIEGKEVGFTWVKAREENGKEHVVYVYVIDENSSYAPEVGGGEDFAGVLKGDGAVWTFGHNNNGELGIASNTTKDIPERTNTNATYKEIKVGNNFTVELREDGTVWSYGRNNRGQLGRGNTENMLSPMQISGIEDIEQIAVGKEHAVAMDSYGILYGWGRNIEGQLGTNKAMITTPEIIPYSGGTISSIWAGENETVIINTRGKVYGYGNILQGEVNGIENAVKVAIGKDYMLILTTNGDVYKYKGNNLTQLNGLSEIVDIDVKGENNIAQTKDERVYTWEGNNEPVQDEKEKIFTIGAGVNNSYIIKTDGTVYAKGSNRYGQLGNSTRIDSENFALIGDRKFTIEPETNVMHENDIEYLTQEIKMNEFNVFNKSVRIAEDYEWTSSDNGIVEVTPGVLKAIREGTAEIKVKDKITGAEVNLIRVVLPTDKDRIESIKVDNNEAIIKGQAEYYVEIEERENTGILEIRTKYNTDKISIDNGDSWSLNGTLRQTVSLPLDETTINILVETENKTPVEYTLKVKKISKDAIIKEIKVDGETATPITSTRYEIVVPEETNISEIIATAHNEKAEVSVNGEGYVKTEATAQVSYGTEVKLEIPIVVRAENGKEIEYILVIYKKSSILNLEKVTVEGKDAIKTSETVYSVVIPRNLTNVQVQAETISELIGVSIDNNEEQARVSIRSVEIKGEVTEVQIRLTAEIEGEEVYKDYTLNIYKKAESGKIELVIVNGQVVERKLDGTYETYLPAETQNAGVTVIAENVEDYVKIEENPEAQTISTVTESTEQERNKYAIKIIDKTEAVEQEYKYSLYINKPSVDARLKEITVTNGENTVTATQSTEEDNVYEVRVKDDSEYTVTAITENVKAKVGIGEDEKVENIATQVVQKTDKYMEVKITVEAESGDIEEYKLKIYVMSGNKELEYIEVGGIRASRQEDGTYLVNLLTAETEVEVKAQAIDELASIKIDNNTFNKHATIERVTIDSRETESKIYIQAEDGEIAIYTLKIVGLPDEVQLEQITVNGEVATYNQEENKYEIRVGGAQFNIEAIAKDSLAKVGINDQEAQQGKNTITIDKQGSKTIVTIKVTAQDGIDSQEYILEIEEKSSDATLESVVVNGVQATVTEEGDYEASIKSNDEQATIEIKAKDRCAKVTLDEETENTDNITVEKIIEGRTETYTIKVEAEDGTTEEYTLTITRLENNTKIEKLTVITPIETGDKTEVVEPEEDGNYYLKIDRVDQADVEVILADSNAKVQIKDSDYVQTQNTVTVETIGERTRVVISVEAEDGTTKVYTLILEKKSNDTSIKTIESEDIQRVNGYTIYVDEEIDNINVRLVTNNQNAYIKLAEEGEDAYTQREITKGIDVSKGTIEVDVKAEDGTIGRNVIHIIKVGNTNLTSVKVSEEETTKSINKYTARINIVDTTKVEIIAENTGAEIKLIKIEDGEETVIAQGTGTLLEENLAINREAQNYIIRVTSVEGATTKDYDLVIELKSTNIGIEYVEVDEKEATKETEGNESYKVEVSKKEKYSLEIKLEDENAEVKIDYDYNQGEELVRHEGEYQKGTLIDEVYVEEGETQEVTITVRSENGETQEYKLYVKRQSDNTKIEEITVAGETVTEYEEETSTYRITIDNTLPTAEIMVKTLSERAKVTIEGETYTQTITKEVTLEGEGKTTIVKVEVEAEDGTTKEYTIEIKQLSADTTLGSITVNGENATTEDGKNYEAKIKDTEELATVVATTGHSESSISIDGENENSQSTTKEYYAAGQRTIEVTIVVKAEDGKTTEEYKLTIIIIDTETDIEKITVAGETVTEYEEETSTYRITIDNTLPTAEIMVKTLSERAKVTIEGETYTQTITKEVTLEGEGKTTIVKVEVEAEDGTTKEYTIEIKQLSADTTLGSITVNGENATTEDGKNYEAKIKDTEELATVVATTGHSESSISIDGENENSQSTTKEYYAAGQRKIEVTIVVKAEDGKTTEEYKLTIIILDTNTGTSCVKVNEEEVTVEPDKVTYKKLIDTYSHTANIEIEVQSEHSSIEITNQADIGIVGNIDDSQDRIIKFTINTPQDVTTIKYRITAEGGETKEYTIILTKESADNSLKKVTVSGQEATKTSDNTYEITVTDQIGITDEVLGFITGMAEIRAETGASTSKVKIEEDDERDRVSTKTMQLTTDKTMEITITVTAQNGEQKEYKLIITIIETNNRIAHVKVNDNNVDPEDDGVTYIQLISNGSQEADIEIRMDGNRASIEITNRDNLTITDENLNEGTLKFKVSTPEDVTTIKFKITSEQGVEKHYTIKLNKESSDNTLKSIVVNGERATQVEANNYEVIIDEAETAEIIATARASTSSVSIGMEEARPQSSTRTYEVNGQKVMQVNIIVIAQTGAQQEYTLTIKILNSNNNVSMVKVNEENVNAEEDKITYKKYIPAESENAKVEIRAESEKSTIEVINTTEVNILTGYQGSGILTFTVDTPEKVTRIRFKVISEKGEAKEYTIILTKLSADNSLKEVWVDDEQAELGSDGYYHATINEPNQVLVKAIATDEFATVRIGYEQENLKEAQATVEADVSPKKVTITVISQSGKTARYYLYIRIIENNTELDRVLVDDNEVTNYNYDARTYTAIVDNTKDDYEVYLMAVNNRAKISVYDGEFLVNGEITDQGQMEASLIEEGLEDGNLTIQITLQPEEEMHVYTVKVYLDEENYSYYTLGIVRKSSDTTLKLVKVDDEPRDPKPEDVHIYEVPILRKTERVKITVETTHEFAMVQISDNEPERRTSTIEIELSLLAERTTVPVVVTAVDGTTDTFNINLIRLSDDASIGRIVVNGTEVENEENVYTYYMPEDEFNAEVQIFAGDDKARIEVDENNGEGYLTFNEPFGEDTIKVEKEIRVTSEDGTTEEIYTLILYKKTQIMGAIITENYEQKYMAKVKLYKRKKKEDDPLGGDEVQDLEEQVGQEELPQDEEIQEVEEELVLDREIETEEDGNFVLEITEVGTYDVVIEKPGYLSYTLAKIEITPGLVVEIQEHKLIAGEEIEDGEIEIADLVELNANLGIEITEENKEEKGRYDLNEDGTIDMTDRTILKKNYGKKAEYEEWVDPNSINSTENEEDE